MRKLLEKAYIFISIGALLTLGYVGYNNLESNIKYRLSPNTVYEEINQHKSVATIYKNNITIKIIDVNTNAVTIPDTTKSTIDEIIVNDNGKNVFKRTDIDNTYKGKLTRRLFEKYNLVNDSLRQKVSIQKKSDLDAKYSF